MLSEIVAAPTHSPVLYPRGVAQPMTCMVRCQTAVCKASGTVSFEIQPVKHFEGVGEAGHVYALPGSFVSSPLFSLFFFFFVCYGFKR